MQPADAWNGTTCGICNREMKGEKFAVDLVLRNKNIKDEHVAGYQCQKCRVCVCYECMKNKFNKASWKNTQCPKCGKSFGPLAILLRNDLDEHTKMVMRERQRSFDSGKVTLPADWKSMLIGVVAIGLGVGNALSFRTQLSVIDRVGTSEYLMPPFAVLLFCFGALGIILAMAPLFWHRPEVMLLQAFNSVIIGALCTMLLLAVGLKNLLPIAFFVWVVYRQLSDYLALKARIKG